MARWPAVALALCVLALAAGPASSLGAQPGATELGSLQSDSFDRIQYRITVFENGSARWTFHYERTLANASEREQFESFAASFEENETQLYTDFRNQSRTLTANGQEATGREMAAGSFARRAFVTTQLEEVGVVEMGFTWDGFARTEGERVVVGDVFEGGLYVGPDQALVVLAGEGLAFRSVEPEGTLSGGSLAGSDSVTWPGERTFTDNHPRVVLGPAGNGATTIPPGGDGGDGTDGGASQSGSPLWPVGLVLLVVVSALGAFVYRRQSSSRAGGTVGSGGDGPPPGTAVDETALLDDEERIAGLLEEHGGRMRQSAIVEATGWSKSKVSMVLSEMAEADEVRKLRVGRENIISLPGHEPDAARPTHEETE